MTVSIETSKVQYVGDGTTTVFSVPFWFFETTHLRVTKLTGTVEVDLTLGSDYSVAGANDRNGGSITTTTAPAAGAKLTITRKVPLTQETDYVPNDPFPAESHEDALDKITQIVQQLDGVVQSSIHLSVSTTGVSSEFPPPEASALIGWNTNGDALRNWDQTDFATIALTQDNNVETFIGDGATLTWNLLDDPGSTNNLRVYIDGLRLTPAVDYALGYSGPTAQLQFTSAPVNGAEIVAQYVRALGSASSPASGSVTNSTLSPLLVVPIANGGTSATTASSARAALGATTVGGNFYTMPNPSAIRFPRINADNTVDALDATAYKSALGVSGGTGTVTYVGMSVPSIFNVAPSSITGSDTFAITTAPQAANNVWAGPISGAATGPTFRVLGEADIPTLPFASKISGTVDVNRGGTGATTASSARTNLGASTVGANMFTLTNPNAITFVRINADNTVSALNATDFKTALGVTGGGTVTSVGLTMPAIFSVSGSPIVSAGNISVSLANQSPNTFFSGPASGGSGSPGFRAIVSADITPINLASTANGGVTGLLPITQGGTNANTASSARTNLDVPGLSTQNTFAMVQKISSTTATANFDATSYVLAAKGAYQSTSAVETGGTIGFIEIGANGQNPAPTINGKKIIGTVGRAFDYSQGSGNIIWGLATEAWSMRYYVGSTWYYPHNNFLVGAEVSVINQVGMAGDNPEIVGLDVVFKNRADGASDVIGPTADANRYNIGTRGIQITSIARGGSGDYCGWQAGILFGTNSLERTADESYCTAIDLEACVHGVSTPTKPQPYFMTWQLDPTSPSDYYGMYFNPANRSLELHRSTAAGFASPLTPMQFRLDTGVSYSSGGHGIVAGGINTTLLNIENAADMKYLLSLSTGVNPDCWSSSATGAYAGKIRVNIDNVDYAVPIYAWS